METAVGSPGAAASAATTGGRQRCKTPGSRGSCLSGSSSSSNSGVEGPPTSAVFVPVKQEALSHCILAVAPATTRSDDTQGAPTAAPEQDDSGEASTQGESLRALQLLLSDVLGVLAMLRPAGSSALPRGVAAAVSRARQAAKAALQEGARPGEDSSIIGGGGNHSRIAAALAAAANTAAVALEQRNPQFAFHQFTILAAASLQQLAPYVTHHLRELLQVLEQRRPLLRLLRSQERRDRQGTEGTAEGHMDNLRLLLQVFLAYCPAAMLDSVCDRLAAAYAQALLNEVHPAQQQRAASAAPAVCSEDHVTEKLRVSETATGVVPDTSAGASDAPRSLARLQGDAVTASVAALLGQRSFLKRLASSIDWGPMRSAMAREAADGGAAVSSSNTGASRGTHRAAEDAEIAAALKRAYSTAACLFDTEEAAFSEDRAGEKLSVSALSSPSAAAAAVGINRRQQLMASATLQPPTSADTSREHQHQQLDPGLGGRKSAAETALTKGTSRDVKETPFSSSDAVADGSSSSSSSTSSHLLRALGSLELPPFLLQSGSSYSRSASPATGLRCSSSEDTAAEAAVAAASSDVADYVRNGVPEGSVADGLSGASAAAAASTALCRPSWQLGSGERGGSSSSHRRTLLQAIADTPEEYGVFLSHRSGGCAGQEKAEFASAGNTTSAAGSALSSSDLGRLATEEKTGDSRGGAGVEDDTATRKATLVSFLLSLLPDSGSYASASASSLDAPVGAAALRKTAVPEDSTMAVKSSGSTQALLNSLQGHLLRYGSEDAVTEQQQHETVAGTTWEKHSRNGGSSLSGRLGLYGNAESSAAGQHTSAGRDGGGAAMLKQELLPQDDATAALPGAISGRSSDIDSSRVKGRGQQQAAAFRQSAAAAASADASDLGGESELGIAGSGSCSYSSLSQALDTAEGDLLRDPSGAPGGANAQLLYRSTISGVVYDKSGQKWTARWSEYGRQHKKTFATAKYGFLHAKKRAEACRLEASRLMREGQGRALAAAARLAQMGGGLQTDSAGSGAPSAFSGLTAAADNAQALNGKDTQTEGEQLLKQSCDADQNLLLKDPQQQLREKEGVSPAAKDSTPQSLLDTPLPCSAALPPPPPKRRRHKVPSADS